MTTSHPTERSYRLAPMQHGMLFHSLSAPDDDMYVVQFACELPPGVDLSALNRAWQSVVNRHDVLRTCFLWKGLNEPLQKVCEDVPIQIEIQDWTSVPVAGEGGLLESYRLHERRRGFDLSTAPLMRFAVIKMARERNLFLWTYSHMLLDGRSRLRVMKEVSLFYDAYCSNQNLELPRPPAYADYIDWFYRQDLSDAEQYWRKVLGTFTTPVKVDLPRRSGEGHSEDSCQTVRLDLSAEVNASLQQLAQSKKLTVNWIVQAAWGVLLARYSGEEDVVYGETRSCRRSDYEEVGSVVGLVMNTVPIRLQVTGTKAFIELLKEVRDQHVQMRSHEGTPLTRIREASGINGRAELFQSIVMFEEYDSRATLQREGCALWSGAISRFSPVNYPLALVGYSKPDLSVSLDYDRRVYSDEAMERLARHLTALLEGIVKDPHARIADLPLLTNAERKQIVYEWNATEAEYPRERCVHELFEAQVAQRPDAVAVVAEDGALTYGELNRRANQLAHQLRELGVGPDQRVAVCLDRSLEMIVGLLAVWKAGGAYLPLDLAYPADRLRYMVEDSVPAVLLKEGHREVPFSGSEDRLPVVELTGAAVTWGNQPDSNPAPAGNGLSARQSAYVIYTSGSTGTPKGVVIEHHSLVNLISWHCASFALKNGMRTSSVASFGFDAATWEIWPPLCVGATLLLPSPVEARDPEALLAWWSEKQPEVSFLPTPIAEFAFAQGIINPLQHTLLVGGDRLHQLPVKALPFALVNNYGPTETTVVATSGLVELSAEVPSIGRPIANTQVYILDEYQQPVPMGVPGELYIGGAGVGRGYLKRPELTAERFVADPFTAEAGARLYRTGDVGRWQADGTIEFLGRNDNQVKLRGYRIELGEIEARLVEHEGVQEAVVVVQGEGAEEKRLVAYYTCQEGREREIGAEELRRHLYTKLPKYMVPAAYVRLEKLPLTPNGKVDRKGLPAADGDAYGVRRFEAPVGEIETVLAGIWVDTLKVERVGRHDDFFELGGHSLRAMRLISQLRQALGVEVAINDLFAYPVLIDFARVVGSAAQTTMARITPAPRGGPLPLSFAQQRLWFLAHMEGVSEAYHIFYGWRLKGVLDYAALRQALDRIVRRHEALRTTFAANNGEPRQWIHSAAESVFHLVEEDLQEQELERVVAQEASARFDLASGPLIRGRLLRLGAQEHALLIMMHHIVADGWSTELLMHELSVLYGAYERGEADPLPELTLQYADYAVWQRQWMAGEVLQKQAEYWKGRLAGAPALLELPMDHARPVKQEYGGGWVKLELEEELTRELNELSKQQGTTLYMTLLAGWSALLARLSGQEDIVVGAPVANRGRLELEGLIGFFVNTLALRLDVSGGLTVSELLQGVKEQVLAGQLHQDIPFEQVVELVDPARSLAHSPIFQVIFAWQSAAEAALALPHLELEKLESPQMVAKFDLILSLQETGERIVGGLKYASALFEQATVERYAEYFGRLLKAMVANPERCIGELPLLSEAERHELIVEWNATAAEYPRDKCVHELFEAQVKQRPDAVAIVAEEGALSYGELNRRANQLAHQLRELGVGPDSRVAVCLERSLEMIVGLLAVWKAGGAYLPLDLAYPADRLRYMVEDSVPAVLLKECQREVPFSGIADRLTVVELTGAAVAWSNQPDSNPAPAGNGFSSRQSAYVIYTSGSTGTPKGVVIEHHSLVNLISWHCASFALECDMRSSSVASFGFDAATWEIWPPLCVGATLLLPSPIEGRDPEALLAWWSEKKPEVSFLPTPIAEFAFAQGIINPRQHTLLVGGDRLHQLPVKALPFALVNNYGPTETTVVATSGLVELSAEVPSIGRPIANTQVYILDEYQQPVPMGVPGELYIGGAGVGRGYLKRPELTAERFVPAGFEGEAGARLYRTGDVGRWQADGTIEFLGRNDNQVKLRGYRIELGEIEARLVEHEGVQEAVVVVQGDTPEEKRLVAYYTCVEGREREIGAEELRRHLYTRLPKYMVPAAYVCLEKMPLTAHGKIDRKGLPAADGDAYGVRRFEAPVGEIETVLAGIWADTLKVERVGRHDDFFELGGHSLRAMRFISQLRQALGVEVAINDLFTYPVLSDFARVVGSAAQTTMARITPAPRGEPLPLSFAQQRLWFLAHMEGVSEAYHIFYGWRLKGVLDYAALRQALDRIVRRHEALRTTFAANNGEPRQWIHSAAESVFHLVEEDLQEQELERVVAQEASARFDLASGPLIRGRLLRLGAQEHALLITMHHIVADGWSLELLMHELSVLYGTYERGEADSLPELTLQYADYAVWQRQWMAGEVLQKQAEYWKRRLAGAPALLELPMDHARPAEQEYDGGWVKLELEEELTRELNELSKQQGTTLYMTLLAGWSALLARLSGQEDIVVGAPVANRGRLELEGLIGFFVNTLALRLDVSGGLTVSELLQGVKEQVLAGQLHQDIPFEQVVELVDPARSLAHSPIFQVIFAWQSAAEAALALPHLELEKLESPQMVAKFDLILSLQETGERIVGGLKYATTLFEQATVERYAEYFGRLLKAMVANPERCIGELPLLSEAERHELIVEWNATAAEYPRDKCVHELFEAQVKQRPDAVAIVAEEGALSYGELNRRANQLAHQLRELGVKPGERVAMLLERSTELVVAQLAVLKSGAAYVPIDPTFPEARQAMMVRDSGAVVAITSAGQRLSESLAVRWVELGEQAAGAWSETNPGLEISSELTAYVMYTSGSTGVPKGVMVPHRAIGRLVLNCGYASFNKEDRVAFASNPAFDASTMEVWGALLNGGSMVVVDREQVLEAGEFEASLRRHGVSVLWMTAGLMNQYAERLGETLGGLRYLIVGGEVLDVRVMAGILSGKAPGHLLNGYGPTETTTFALTHEIKEVTEQSIPLGRPIANTQVYILDSNWEPTPVGVKGELYIGGAGVAEGYLKRPELTAERFVPNGFGGELGARLYRTGDLGRWNKEREIEFERRNDSQVKLRGFRIELGEIEARLAEHEGVKDAVVVVQGDAPGEKRLVAYYTLAAHSDAGNGEVGEEQVRAEVLRAELGKKLPEYMVPVAYVRLEKMPLTQNGKVDRGALPVPEGDEYGVGKYEEPRGEVERTLAEIWAEVLKLERVGRHDDFFELGGHSLLMMSVMNRIRMTMGIQFPIRILFEAPTVSDLAERINSIGTTHMPLRPAMLQSRVQAK